MTSTSLQRPDEQADDKKSALFSIKAIGVATYLGGPIAGGWLIALNYNRLNNAAKRNQILCYTLIFTIALFATLMIIPEKIMDYVPNYLIPTIYTPLFALYAQKFQGADIRAHQENGAKKGSAWTVFNITLCSLLCTFALIIGMVLIMEPHVEPYEFEGTVYHYGEQSHVIYHNEVDLELLNKCGDFLLATDYFHGEYQGIMQVHRDNDRHHVYLTFSKDYWGDQEFLGYVQFLKSGLEDTVFDKPIYLTITDEDYNDVYKKEI